MRLFLSEMMPRERAERLAALLAELAWPPAAAVSNVEADESADLWRVEALWADDADLSALPATLAAAGFDAAVLREEPLPERDWVAEVQRRLSPVRAGRFFVHGAHDRARRPRNAIAIEIEAGQAFGTGHHGTTKGCLLALEELLKTRRLSPGAGRAKVLDVGTGSGLLAIAAARAGLGPVVAGDIDPLAVRTARANARLGGAGAVRFVTAAGVHHPLIRRFFAPLPVRRRNVPRPGLARARAALAATRLPQSSWSRWRSLKPRATPRPGGGYDLIFANILARPLIRLAPDLSAMLRAGGHLVLSGLLMEQENAVLAAFAPRRLRSLRRFRLDGWSTLLLEKAEKEGR